MNAWVEKGQRLIDVSGDNVDLLLNIVAAVVEVLTVGVNPVEL
ncbi:hypothetical protein [Mycobacterium xenopi]|nr:hypothetical protein [Mycobacterium xenopi]